MSFFNVNTSKFDTFTHNDIMYSGYVKGHFLLCLYFWIF